MAKRVKWQGNAADLPQQEHRVRYVGTGQSGNTYQLYGREESSSDVKKGFIDRLGLAASGGAKGSLAGNMDAMGVAYEAGQGGRTKRNTDDLKAAQWAVARAKHDYDVDPSRINKTTLESLTSKMKVYADVLGEGAYEQALQAAYDAAAQFDTGDLTALYNSMGVVTPKTGTGVQQQAAKAARDLAAGVQQSAAEDIQEAKEGTSKFWQMAVDAAASTVQVGLDAASNAVLGTQGSMIPFATRAFGGATVEARQDGADLGRQALYGAAQTAKEVFTEKMFNIALPYAKTYGKGGLDGIVENGIRKAADKLGKSKVGKAALEKVLNFGASAATEGLEELIGDWMEWQLPRIYGGDVATAEETLSRSLYDFVVGSMAGMIGGAVAEPMKAIDSSVQAQEVKKAYGAQQRDLVNESEELNPGNKLAQKYKERLDRGKDLSGRQLMRIMGQNEADTLSGDREKIQSAAESRLTELGEKDNVQRLAEIVAKQTAGDALSNEEQAQVDSSKYGKRVLNELNPENVKVGENGSPRDTYSSSWTGSIGTSVINSATYNRNIGVTGAKYNPETQKLDAIVKDREGNIQTVPLKEAKASPIQEELFDWAEDLKEAGPVMVGAYQPTQNLELYAKSFRLAYEYGKAHVPMDYVENSEAVNYLHPTQIKLAYEEGAKAQQRQAQAAEEKITSGGTRTALGKKKTTVSLGGATVGGTTYAPVNRKTLNRRQWASVEAMRALSRATGVDVVFYQSRANEKSEYEGANGFYKDDTIYLDINAGRNGTQDMRETAVLKTAAHELTHFIQQNSPKQYEELKQFVVERLVQQEGVSFEDLVTDKQRREPDLSYGEAVDELVADACEMMLKDSKAAEQLAKENRSLAERIRQWIRKWVRSLKAAMEGLTADRPESRAMMQYAQELQEIWDNALVDAVRNGRGTVQENAPAEVKQQARVGTSESIKSDEKSLKGKRDDGKMDAVKDLLKEDLDGGEERKEDRGAFLRRATGEGLRIFEGDSIAYGYRTVPWGSAGENARQVQKELTALGIDAEITEGYVHWNLNGISSRRAISQAVTIEKRKVLISNRVSLPSKNAAGHEAFHFWGSTQAREAYADELSDNLNFSSKEFVEYQAVIAEAYLGGEADLSDSTQLQKLREELFAYISGDIHEGVNDDLLRPMFHDYDAVKAAWVKLCKDRAGGKVQFQQREYRMSDRDVLAWAAEMAQQQKNNGWTDEDRNRLDIFATRMNRLNEAEAELAALKEERKDLLAGRKVSEVKGEERDELLKNKNRIDIAREKAKRLESEVYEIESVAVVKTLLKKARSIVEQDSAARARAEYREKRETAEQMAVTRRKVERSAKRLMEYMTTNTDKKHIPETLKQPIGELLESLNFYSNSARKGGYTSRGDYKYFKAMEDLQAVLQKQRTYEEGGDAEEQFSGYLDLPQGFESLLANHVSRVRRAMENRPLKTTVVREMDLDDLKELDVILSVMSRSVTRMNELFVNRRFGLVADAAEDSIYTMATMEQHQDKKGESFLLWDNTLPWYAFQRFGEGGKAVFEALQDGWDKLAFNTKTILDFRKELIPDNQVRKWDTEIREVELLDSDGAAVKVKLTTAQLMSLHCLSKRKQALGHLLGGGIRPYAVELTEKKIDKLRKKTLKQDKQFKLTEESLGQLLRLLTPEQVKVADAMQKFMTEQGSAWGNEVSMTRFGYRAFTEQNYFPIETDNQDRPAKTGDAKEGSLYRLQNISAVKPLTKNANNALVLRGIFDVFANHTADMAKYNALVLPILDAQKWYNYKYASKNEAGQVSTRTVQRAMTKAYGASANNYVVKYLQDLNGVKESGDRSDKLATKMISNYKRAMVAANLRVAFLQPTAYVRASAVIDYKYLTAAFADKTGTRQAAKEIKQYSGIKYLMAALADKTGTWQAAKEMKQYSGIALWKSMGFFDTDVGRSMRDQIKGSESKLENIVDKTMKPAEWGDEITWARLWRACKLEVRSQQKLTGEELLEATAKRFREVIYRTQVVDSTMTRSHKMRSSSTMSKMATSFMSEPTVSYNMVMDSTVQIAQDAKKMGLRVAIRRNWKTAGRSYQAYIVSAVVTAIVESLYDALRDTDDDEYLDKVWKAFGGEKPETVKDQVLSTIFGLNGNLAGDINPIGKLPFLRDAVSIFGGYDNGRMDMEALANLKKSIDIWSEAIRLETGKLDKATKTTYYGNMTTYGMIYPTAQALSQLSGLPASGAMREVITAWNNTVGIAFPQMKRRTYESKKLREAWEEYGKDSGISYTTMYRAVEAMRDIEGDKDEDGNTVSGSQKAKYVEYIRSLGLTRTQEKAVWEAAKVSSWSDKGTPWG